MGNAEVETRDKHRYQRKDQKQQCQPPAALHDTPRRLNPAADEAACSLDHMHQHQHDNDDEHEAEATDRTVTP
jgi:hypothetical protein